MLFSSMRTFVLPLTWIASPFGRSHVSGTGQSVSRAHGTSGVALQEQTYDPDVESRVAIFVCWLARRHRKTSTNARSATSASRPQFDRRDAAYGIRSRSMTSGNSICRSGRRDLVAPSKPVKRSYFCTVARAIANEGLRVASNSTHRTERASVEAW